MNRASGYAVYESPFGMLRIGYEDDIVTSLAIIDDRNECGQRIELTEQVYAQVMEYLDGERTSFQFPYELRGTDFQKKVWEELTRIPYGETRTYKEIAATIGNPKASRAVGMANNRNPILIAIPCHRVIGADGKLVGYAGGLEMKRSLLELERKGKSIQHETNQKDLV